MGDELEATIRTAFALRDGEDPIEFVRELGWRLRRLEDAFDSDLYPCPECEHGQIRVTVLDALVGAVYVEGTCCLDDDQRVVAAALERNRLAQLLGGGR